MQFLFTLQHLAITLNADMKISQTMVINGHMAIDLTCWRAWASRSHSLTAEPTIDLVSSCSNVPWLVFFRAHVQIALFYHAIIEEAKHAQTMLLMSQFFPYLYNGRPLDYFTLYLYRQNSRIITMIVSIRAEMRWAYPCYHKSHSSRRFSNCF